MIPVSQALDHIFSTRLALPEEPLPLEAATGRILAEPLVADRDFPPYDRVTMDGIALSFQAFAQGQRSFPIQGMQAAGQARQRLNDPQACIEIMTGAVRPEGTDVVVRYEDVEMVEENGNRQARLAIDALQPWKNVHRQGSDHARGKVLCKAGKRITAAEVAIAATVGKHQLRVRALPRVALVSTGDELVPIAATPLPHQIRRSNAHMVAAALQETGAQTRLLHLKDEPDHIRNRLQALLQEEDVLVLSGGVSMGKADYLPRVLAELGVQKRFHKVRQRPGKPFWFGVHEEAACVVFALPGNPVSSFVGCYRYVRPWLRAQLGEEAAPLLYARLSEPVHFKPPLTYFMQAQVHSDETGQLWARPLQGAGSGDHANLLYNNAILELPGEERSDFDAGEAFPLYAYRKWGQ